MILETRYFGELEVDESGIIYFNSGLPGFDEVRRFVMIENEDKASPFKWLQGVDEPKPAFVIVDPFAIKRDYEINIDDETLNELGIASPDTVAVYSIVVVPEDITKMTMNLQAPLIINTENRKGKQLILDTERYGVRHYILDELQGREEAENARADKEEGSVHCYK
ncbi:MAG: flagellar assembly protein FliW [Bacillota bacterium]